MPDKRAEQIVALRDSEISRQANFRSMWQSVADLMFPQTYGIETTRAPGSMLMNGVYDTTGLEEAENMASGIANNLFPAGQQFFATKPTGHREPTYAVKRYLSELTEIGHEEIFQSNYIAQVTNTIHYWLTFGIGNLYSEWTVSEGLNYRDYAIGTYQCIENAAGVIDTMILTCPMTAAQIHEKWGEGSGESVLKAMRKPETESEEFNVIQSVRPRKDRKYGKLGNTNMPFESLYIQEKDRVVLEESGYDEFPFAVPRYQVVYREVYGRGRGTMLLPQVRVLNRLAKDFQEISNKSVNPPREILESFDGSLDVTPGAENYVMEIPSTRPIEFGHNGAFPVNERILEYHREAIRQGFFKNAFEALTNLTGDRRTTTEIIERLKEGMKKLSKPLGHLFIELLTPNIGRSLLLLIRNGVAPPPPPELKGIKIEFVNPLALALRDQQSRGLQYWVAAGMEMEQSIPGILDNVDADVAYRDLGASMGVKTDHIRSVTERDEIREERQERMEQRRKLEMAQQMADGYGKITKAPESGSPAENL